MNVMQQAVVDINELNRLSGLCAEARAAFEQRRTTPPSIGRPKNHTVVYAGKGMARIVNTTTGKVVGFRQSHKEALWLAQQLDRDQQANS